MKGRLCVFGEVLFDEFPGGPQVLGGAPFNVAWHLQAFGERPWFVSRVGDDAAGAAVRSAMEDWGMDTSGLQTDPALPTGRVRVTLESDEPRYDIVQPAAWDAIAAPRPLSPIGLLYHGSLALRAAASAAALETILASVPRQVFVDVNLRPPWWQRERLLGCLRRADWVKLNQHELEQLHPGLRSDAAQARSFLAAYDLKGLVVTHGASGAEVLTAAGQRETVEPGREVGVVDTVGAGDAFAAVMMLGLLRDWPLGTVLQRAQAFASRIVGVRGATVFDPVFYRDFLADWDID